MLNQYTEWTYFPIKRKDYQIGIKNKPQPMLFTQSNFKTKRWSWKSAAGWGAGTKWSGGAGTAAIHPIRNRVHLGQGIDMFWGRKGLLTRMAQTSKSPASVCWTPITPQLTPVTLWSIYNDQLIERQWAWFMNGFVLKFDVNQIWTAAIRESSTPGQC